MPFNVRLLTRGLALGATLVAASASAQPADVVRARQLLAEARTVAEKWSDPDPARFMVGQVAGAQARAGDRQAALATATSISRTGWGWMAAAKGFADAGDVDAALEFADKIDSRDDMMSKIVQQNLERDDTLREVALRRTQRGDFKGTLRAIRAIGFSPIAARGYAALAEAQARAGDAAEARRSFALAASAADQAQPNPYVAIMQLPAWDDIAKSQWRAGDRTAALAAFDKGLAAARRTPDGYHDCAFAIHAADRAEVGDVAGALRILQEVKEPRRMPAAPEVARMARGLAEAGQHERALEAAAMASGDWRVNAGAELGGVYLRKGDARRAAEIFERVIAAAERTVPDRTGPVVLVQDMPQAVVRVQARDGDPTGALRSADRLVRARPRDSDDIYGALATGQAEAGDSEAALRTVALITGYPPQPEMWRALGRAAGRRGNVDAVLARAPEAQNRRAALLIGLAEGLVDRAEGIRPR
jgi:tetratricopeptide (TPR) repeat protein